MMKKSLIQHGKLLSLLSIKGPVPLATTSWNKDLLCGQCQRCQGNRCLIHNTRRVNHPQPRWGSNARLQFSVSNKNVIQATGNHKRNFLLLQTNFIFEMPYKLGLFQVSEFGNNIRCYSSSSNTIQDASPVSSTDIKSFLNENEMSFKQGHTCYITTCPRVVRKRMKLADVEKMYVNMTTGYFVCLTCKRCGSWSQFQDNIHNLLESMKKKRKLQQCLDGVAMDANIEGEKARELWDQSMPITELPAERLEYLQHVFDIQVLRLETLLKFKIHTLPDSDTLIFPVFSIDGILQGVKVLTHKSPDNDQGLKGKITTKTIPRLGYHGFFGLNTVPVGFTEAVLTASEFDAMAVHQATNTTALALPKGISALAQEVLPLVEQCSNLKLWLGETMQSWEAAKHFSRKLSDARCSLIRPGEAQPSPLVALRKGLDLSAILRSSRQVVHKSIVTFKQLRQEVFSEFSQIDQIAGIKWKRFPQMTSLLKGHRRGELTVFTGPTGSGKTTFISEYSVDLCEQGVTTLWGSFEINNARLIRTMLTQYSQINLTKNLRQFDEWADRFELLPMYFMTFHGAENIKRVIETMSHAVYIHDINHVVVDNLQFMMGSTTVMTTDKYAKQDLIIAAFRKFATQMNCHVTLVIHPRKERETDELTVSSIFGSAKATQEADNVLILQNRDVSALRARKYLQVAKNRFDGDLGVMALKFDKNTLSFAPKAKSEPDKKLQQSKPKVFPDTPADDMPISTYGPDLGL